MIPATPFLVGLVICLLILVILKGLPTFRILGRWLILPILGIGMIHASRLNDVTFAFVAETGIWDAGSYVDYSTRTLHARWGYHPWAAGGRFRWFYSRKYGDNKGPFQLPDANIEDCAASYQLPIPEGEDLGTIIVRCYSEFVKPPSVITNGVYHLTGVMRPIGDDSLPSPRFVTPLINITTDTGLYLTPTNQPKIIHKDIQ